MIVIELKHGQLGNQLNLYAHFIALSLDTGVTIINPSFMPYAAMFEGTGRGLNPISRFVYWVLGKATPILAQMPAFERWVQGHTALDPKQGIIYLDTMEFKAVSRIVPLMLTQGYGFRYRNRTSKQQTIIRTLFMPIPPLQARIHALAQNARADADVLIGVSIRQGDYQEHLAGRFYFETEAYVEQMKVCQALFPNQKVRFLVCSNEKQDPAMFEGLPVTFGQEEAVVELYALARCDLLLGVPSSFVYWASFYGNVPLYRMTDGKAPVAPDAIAVMEYF